MLETGSMVGSYRILRLLGEGGMGVVYAAEHVVLRRQAAIKVLHPYAAQHPEIAQRFVNEAIAAAALKHRNIVGVMDCGQLANGQWFIALDFLAGEPLSRFMHKRAGQPIELPTILHILAESANGLFAAHQLGIVHRDVKPDNLFLTTVDDDPCRVVVLDFGIAKLGEHAQGLKTRDNVMMGTPAYMAPEQFQNSAAVTPKADIYALALIAYEMVTGKRAWGDVTSAFDIIKAQSTANKAPDPRAVRSDLSKKWASVISRALDPDPRRRWSDMREFIQALAHATPTTYSADGMSILDRYASELAQLPSDSATVGRKLPSELLSPPSASPITAPQRPAPPATISDGVPRSPTAQMHEFDALRNGDPGRPISTLAASTGQSIPPPAAPLSRPTMLAAVGTVGVLAVIAVAFVATRGGGNPSTAAAPKVVSIDAGIAAPDAVVMSALAIVTEPAAAEVFINGVSKGPSPVNVSLPVGAEVEVRAELAGHTPATQSVRVSSTPGAIRLALTAIVDAGTPRSIDAGVVHKRTTTSKRTGRQGSGQGSTAGSGSTSGPAFNPDDVGGD